MALVYQDGNWIDDPNVQEKVASNVYTFRVKNFELAKALVHTLGTALKSAHFDPESQRHIVVTEDWELYQTCLNDYANHLLNEV